MHELFVDFRSGLAALSWSRFPFYRFAAAIGLSLLGAWTFLHFGLPLPWMLGPLGFCTLAALFRLPVAAPVVVRPPMAATIGVMLGAAFTPQVLGHISLWAVPVGGLVVFLSLSALVCITYLRVVGGLDHVTAYYAGMPGGLSDMVLLADQHGANPRTVALVHASRALLIIFGLPFILQYALGVDLSARQGAAAAVHPFSLLSLTWLAGTAIVGVIVGHYLRLPAKALLGSMVVSASLHLTGLSSSTPPTILLNAAQLVLGATIGCRFLGASHREALNALWLSVGSSILLLGLTFGCAFVVSGISEYEVVPLILAYSPGGLTEMSLLALALGIEVAFVAAHHILRLFLVIAGAAGLSRVFVRRSAREDEE